MHYTLVVDPWHSPQPTGAIELLERRAPLHYEEKQPIANTVT
jgi:hypothetical protein